MERRTLRSKKGKPRTDRPYDRQNQGIFGKVCSTVKGLLNTSWLFGVSNSTGDSEEEQNRSSPDDVQEEPDRVRDDNDVIAQSSMHSNKRLRLRYDGQNYGDNVSIQSSGTQTWHDQPHQNIYNPIPHISSQSSSTQSTLLENKEAMAVLNGDDHSENSEGSASTSGCSSLISSHKESNRLAESSFSSLLDRQNRKRKEPSKSAYNDFSNSSSLWSTSFSPSSKFQRRLNTVPLSNQPSFNISTFAGPSKLIESADKKITSPFYEGRTTFGGASARRMPPSTTPYQVDKSLRNQIKVRDQGTDNLKCLSTSAKRILSTLEKMTTPVTDAKKIPNADTIPVDLSVYLTPPRSHRNSQFTPSIASKGPPIVNINDISKVATLRNYGANRLRNTLQRPVTPVEQKKPSVDPLQSCSTELISQKSGGGKIKNKLNQHHRTSKNVENEIMDTPILKNVPLPISSLPTINFGFKPDKPLENHLPSRGFTLSNPIEYDLSVNNTVPATSIALPSGFDSFKFSNPIEHELPSNKTSPEDKAPSLTWECNACWVRNPSNKAACLACETPRVAKETNFCSNTSTFSSLQASQAANGVFQFGGKTLESTAASVSVPSVTQTKNETSNKVLDAIAKDSVSAFGSPACSFTFGTTKNEKLIPNVVSENTSKTSQNHIPASSVAAIFGNTSVQRITSAVTTTVSSSTIKSGSETWECSACWVRNPIKDSKCMACETPRSAKDKNSGQGFVSTSTSTTTTTNTGNWECSACWVRNSVRDTKCVACETPQPGKDKDPEPKSLASDGFSTWECTSCWVRNPKDVKKCMACETLHPSAEMSSAIKDKNGFKFSSPMVNSPITFKFGNYVCTSASTTPTSSFKFGVSAGEAPISSTTAAPSGFKFNAPANTNSVFGQIASAAVSTSTVSSSDIPSTTVSSFKMPDSVVTSGDKTQDGQTSNIFSTISQTSNFASVAKESQSVSGQLQANSDNKVAETIKDAFIKVSGSDTGLPKFNPDSSGTGTAKDTFIKESTAEAAKTEITKTSGDKQSENVITTSCNNSISKEKEVPAPSVTACFGFTTQPVLSVSKDKKPAALFGNSESKATSAFTPPVNIFKFGENNDTIKNNSTVALTTTTTPSFSFTTNSSNFGAVSSKADANTFATLQSQPATAKLEESNLPTSTSVSSGTTASTFVFGSTATTSAPSAFSFFPSSSTANAPAPVFTFGASSTKPEMAKSGGFTFKPQTTPVVSTSSLPVTTGLNAGTTAPVPSAGGFVFGAPKVEAQNTPSVSFAFGSAPTMTASSASTFSAFHAPQPTGTTFQFGSQPPKSTAPTLGTSSPFVFGKSENPVQGSTSQNTATAFVSTASSFVFGAKSETPNPTSAVSQAPNLSFGKPPNFTFTNKTESALSQNPTPAFGASAMAPVFGSNPVQPTFDGIDKAAAGGFTFGATSSNVFQFGASNNSDKKRTAAASGFTFGTPAAPDTSNAFQSAFTMNTPPSFNFGAASTPAGTAPFQFAASAAPKPTSAQNAPQRKIRKALRRVPRKD